MDRFAIIGLCTLVAVVAVDGRSLIKDEEIDHYLTRLGYAPLMPNDIHADGSQIGFSYARQDAIKKFQRYFGLRVTGELDAATKAKMSEPRCGFPDISTGQLQRLRRRAKRRAARTRGVYSPAAFSFHAGVWEHRDLTWGLKSFTRKLSSSYQRRAMRQALDLWAKVAPLTFREVRQEDKADIEMSFARYEHNDGRGNAFDGPGMTLAHAYGPGGSDIAGDVHFDDDETWIESGTRQEGTDLLVVAAHEVGHSLGLGHSNDRRALMYPSYKDYTDLQLGSDDINGIRTLYGSATVTSRPPVTRPRVTSRPRVTVTPQPTPQPTTPIPTTTTADPHCIVPFSAVIEAPEPGEKLGFMGGRVYRMDQNGVKDGYPRPISEEFPGGPDAVDMATSTLEGQRSKIFITRGSQVWSYRNGALEEDFPKAFPLEQYSEKPRFLLSLRDDYSTARTFVFGRTFWWEVNFDGDLSTKPMEYLIEQNWNDVSSEARYAISGRHGIYLVSDSSHVLLGHRTRSAEGGERPGLPDPLQSACRAIQSDLPSSASVPLVSMVTALLMVLIACFLN